MSNPETPIVQAIRLAVSRGAARLFRNNVGVASFPNGTVVRYGLAPGSSDLVGWRTVTIKPRMVGQRLAVFVALEVKTTTGRTSRAQRAFLEAVYQAGGIAAVVRSPEEAEDVLKDNPDAM